MQSKADDVIPRQLCEFADLSDSHTTKSTISGFAHYAGTAQIRCASSGVSAPRLGVIPTVARAEWSHALLRRSPRGLLGDRGRSPVGFGWHTSPTNQEEPHDQGHHIRNSRFESASFGDCGPSSSGRDAGFRCRPAIGPRCRPSAKITSWTRQKSPPFKPAQHPAEEQIIPPAGALSAYRHRLALRCARKPQQNGFIESIKLQHSALRLRGLGA